MLEHGALVRYIYANDIVTGLFDFAFAISFSLVPLYLLARYFFHSLYSYRLRHYIAKGLEAIDFCEKWVLNACVLNLENNQV